MAATQGFPDIKLIVWSSFISKCIHVEPLKLRANFDKNNDAALKKSEGL